MQFVTDFLIVLRAFLSGANEFLGIFFSRRDIAIYGIPYLYILIGLLFLSFVVGIIFSFFDDGD